MRIELRGPERRRLGRVELDEQARPARVAVPGVEHDFFPQWDAAFDDSGSLRKCVACGGEHLYRRRNLPQVTPVVAVLAFSGAMVSILGYAAHAAATALLVALLVADLLIITLAVRQLVCYRCGATHEGVRVARYHRPWDRTMAEKVAREEREAEGRASTAQAPSAEPPRETREAT